MKLQSTGVVQLLGDLNNRDVWLYIANGMFEHKEGKAWFPLDNGQQGKVSLIITTVISKGKVPIEIASEISMIDLLHPERSQYQKDLQASLAQIFQAFVNQSWLLLGAIVTTSGTQKPVAMLYFEGLDQVWYSLIDIKQKQVIEQYVQYLN